MFWGAIPIFGKVFFNILEGKIISKIYADFLMNEILPEVRKLHGHSFIL